MKISFSRLLDVFFSKLKREQELPFPQTRLYMIVPVSVLLAGCIWPQVISLARGMPWLAFCLEVVIVGIPPFLKVSILPRHGLRVGTAISFGAALVSMLTGVILSDCASTETAITAASLTPMPAGLTGTKIAATVANAFSVAAVSSFFWFLWEYRRAELQFQANDTFFESNKSMSELIRTSAAASSKVIVIDAVVECTDVKE